jgi:diguanylate cyclase (GGDEF)-like protein
MIRILMVEDLETDAVLARRELVRAGLDVETLRVDREHAFRRALAESSPDVILCDYSMPQFHGMTALEIARECAPHVPFILVSGTIGEEAAVGALREGAVDYVLKTNLMRLPSAVERAIREAELHAAARRAAEELRASEASLRRLNRVHTVLSGINSLIVRVRERDELFREACRLAVRDGRFACAWIGVVDRAAMRAVPVAMEGLDHEYAELLPLDLKEDAARYSLAGEAVRTLRPAVADDIATDPRMSLKAQATARGLHSLVILPLIVGGAVTGVLALYATEIGFFDDAEMKLLRGLADDIAFALEHIEKSEAVEYLSYYQPITGLANRALLMERLSQVIGAADREQRKVGLALVDIDRFKTINDSLGRKAGDALLAKVAARLVQITADDARRVAHLGGDRFAVTIPYVDSDAQVAREIERVAVLTEGEPFEVADTELRIAIKAGVAMFPSDADEADALFRNAEAALKKAKSSGERYLFYTQRMTERVAERLLLETRLRQAVEREEFVLHYQPKTDLGRSRILGIEALIRWKSPDLGLVPPNRFIPLLEETGLILQAGAWAMRQAALDHRGWVEEGLPAPRIAVNVSAIQLRQRNFVATLELAMAGGATPGGLDLEITESLIMEDIESNIEKLHAARKLGVNIAIDDFGTGYSSLAYLAKLPIDALKIDRAFITGMTTDANTATLVKTIVSMAHSLKLHVVAEGVESEAQVEALKQFGCDQMQGYLFSRPLPLADMSVLLRRQDSGPSGSS